LLFDTNKKIDKNDRRTHRVHSSLIGIAPVSM
jgi:hypothetical protein